MDKITIGRINEVTVMDVDNLTFVLDDKNDRCLLAISFDRSKNDKDCFVHIGLESNTINWPIDCTHALADYLGRLGGNSNFLFPTLHQSKTMGESLNKSFKKHVSNLASDKQSEYHIETTGNIYIPPSIYCI